MLEYKKYRKHKGRSSRVRRCDGSTTWTEHLVLTMQKGLTQRRGKRPHNMEFNRYDRCACPHYDLAMNVAQVSMWWIEPLLVYEGSGSSIIFSNCFEIMKLPWALVCNNTGDVYGFSGHKSNPIGHNLLDITIMGKSLTIIVLVMDSKSPGNAILGRDWTVPMEAIV